VIAATNRDLKAAMAAGEFRGDLFYRLNVIPISVPPLRERREDIPLLVDHVLKRLKRRGMERVKAVSPEAMRCLMEYPWPGNIRELENILERGMVCARGRVLSVEDLPDELQESCRARRELSPEKRSGGAAAEAPRIDPAVGGEAEGERGSLLRTLEAHRWSRKEAAASLGIDRTTLWRKMRRLGLA
jgi:DNA-binding NtrC family response regulator